MSSSTAISVNHLSKVYELGLSGRTTSLATIVGDRIRHPIRGGGRRRDRVHALDDVSFDVAAGEVVGVIGKNGAGKSTLLKILSRITPPSGGYIDMAGSVGSLLEVGTGFHPELTGLENVYLNGSILGMSTRDIDQRLEEIVEFAEVDQFLQTPVKRYSSGMRVRLAFAVAAHLDPEILIVDEVLSVGDAGFQARCLEKMRSIASDGGRTVLYVSHNLVTVENLCPRALLIEDGRLVFDGETGETIARYMAAFPQGRRSGETAGVFDLVTAERLDRRYERVFSWMALRPGGGTTGETVRVGQPLQIEIGVQGLDARSNARVALTVGSASTQRLFTIGSRMRPLEAAHARCPEETIVVDIPSVLLTPGDYHIDVGVHDSGPVDVVRRAAEFTVAPADVFGTGYHHAQRDGLFVTPWSWEIRPSIAEHVAVADELRRPGQSAPA